MGRNHCSPIWLECSPTILQAPVVLGDRVIFDLVTTFKDLHFTRPDNYVVQLMFISNLTPKLLVISWYINWNIYIDYHSTSVRGGGHCQWLIHTMSRNNLTHQAKLFQVRLIIYILSAFLLLQSIDVFRLVPTEYSQDNVTLFFADGLVGKGQSGGTLGNSNPTF